MIDRFTETTTQSWFSRIKSSFGGMLIGSILVFISFPVLFSNEGRAVKTAKSLEEGAAAVVHVQPDSLKKSNDGKLVHFTGMTETRSMLRDPVFGVEAKALKLSRKVEMYQWKQTTSSTTREKLGGGKETTTTYEYEKEWSDQLQASKDFKNRNGHENPTSMPYKAETLAASDVTVGDYQIPQHMIAGLDGGTTPLPLDAKSIASAPGGYGAGNGKPRLDQGSLYYGWNPATPQVGDVRVSFASMGLSEISVIGRQSGKTIEPYPTKAGRNLEMARVGSFGAEAMFAGAMRSNTVLTWVLRIGGFLLMFIGSSMIFKPLVMVGKFVPMIGSIIGAGTGLLAFGLSSVASLATIALAWFVYRPLLSIVLLVLGAVVGAFVLTRGRTKTVAQEAANTSPTS